MGMFKRLCIFLIGWLPCFVMAAQLMSLQMTLAEVPHAPATAVVMTASAAIHADEHQMPCHQTAPVAAADASHHTPPHGTHCTVCGFCLMNAGMAALDAFPVVSAQALVFAAPAYVHAPVHSLSFPPAIKPPIFA